MGRDSRGSTLIPPANEIHPASEPPPRKRRKWWFLIVVALAAVVTIWLLRSGSKSGSAELLADRPAFENRLSRAVNVLPGALGNALRKLKYRLFGPPKVVLTDVLVIRFAATPALAGATELAIKGGDKQQNLQFLLVPVSTVDAFRSELKQILGATILASSRLTVFSGHAASMASLGNPSSNAVEGFTVDLRPRSRSDVMDLAIRAEALSPILNDANLPIGTSTNVMASAQISFRTNSGVLVVPRNASGACTGVFILPTVFRSKR
jgi:hypothetical protein